MLRNGQVNTFGGTIYFAVDGTTQETSIDQTKPDSKNPELLHNPFLSQANGISFRKENLNSSWPAYCRYPMEFSFYIK